MLLKETRARYCWALADVPLDRLREVRKRGGVCVCVCVCVCACVCTHMHMLVRAWTERKS